MVLCPALPCTVLRRPSWHLSLFGAQASALWLLKPYVRWASPTNVTPHPHPHFTCRDRSDGSGGPHYTSSIFRPQPEFLLWRSRNEPFSSKLSTPKSRPCYSRSWNLTRSYLPTSTYLFSHPATSEFFLSFVYPDFCTALKRALCAVTPDCATTHRQPQPQPTSLRHTYGQLWLPRLTGAVSRWRIPASAW